MAMENEMPVESTATEDEDKLPKLASGDYDTRVQVTELTSYERILTW